MPYKILIVDNNDSFTFNIVELLRSITGEKPAVKNSNTLKIKTAANYSHIIFSPGPGLPEDFPVMNELLSVFSGNIPVLGICLGHQAICKHYGMDLYNLDEVIHGQTKKINVITDSILYKDLPSQFDVGLYHSWSVRENGKSIDLNITALSSDGQIMSVENREKSIFGVQFHPESYITRYGKELVSNFLLSGS
jgi:para-aminobenzoate synthetase component II